MPDFSALIPETYQNISSGYLETLIQSQREALFTGLLRLGYPSDENLVFTFLEGVQQKLYRSVENTIAVIPKQTWFDAFDHRNAAVGFLPLPVEAVRFTRVAYEAPVLRVEESTFAPEELADAAGKWSIEQDAGIVHVQGEKVNRYYLIAGHSTPIIEELSFVEGEARFSIGDASFPQLLPKADYHVLRYVSNQTRAGGWNIIVTSNGAVNRHYFDSLESATNVYVDLLRRFRHEASLALGSRLVDDIAREILIKLDPYRRELLTRYVYSQPGVGSLAGVVER